MTEMPEFVTIQEFAKRMRISRSWAYRVVRTMPPGVKTKVAGGIRILVEPLNEWLKAGGGFAKECAE